MEAICDSDNIETALRAVSALTLVAASAIAGITGRTPPPPIVGITYDDVSNTGPEHQRRGQ